MASGTEDTIRTFIRQNFPTGPTGGDLSVDQSLLQSGIIDSIGVLTLVTFLEDEFKIRIEDDEVVPANLDSIGALVRLIERKQTSGQAV